MKNVWLVFLLVIGVAGCGVKESVRLHGSLKEFGTDVVLMNFDGAAGMISDEWTQRIPVNKDGSFDFTFELKEPAYYAIGRNILWLTPGDDLEVDLRDDQRESLIKGKGAEANNYLKGHLFPKGGSFLRGGCLNKDFGQTRGCVEQRAAEREKELKALKNVSDEFVETEMMRIKADVVCSYMAYPAYSSMLRSPEEQKADPDEFYRSIREVVNPLLKEIAAKDEYLETGSVRDALLSCYDMDASGIALPKSQRLKEFIEVYMKGQSMDGEMTRALYDELYAFGSGLKNADFKQAFLGRLEERTKLMEGQPAIDFAVVDMDGKKGRLSDYKGKVLYVDFWATWCGPCLGEMPRFNELSKKYPGIQFIGVSVDDDAKAWQNKLQRDADHGNVLELLSQDPLVRTEWDITGIPRFLLIDPEFRIISAAAPWPSDTEAITPLLEKYNKK